jgi:hypothetical protein
MIITADQDRRQIGGDARVAHFEAGLLTVTGS